MSTVTLNATARNKTQCVIVHHQGLFFALELYIPLSPCNSWLYAMTETETFFSPIPGAQSSWIVAFFGKLNFLILQKKVSFSLLISAYSGRSRTHRFYGFSTGSHGYSTGSPRVRKKRCFVKTRCFQQNPRVSTVILRVLHGYTLQNPIGAINYP